MKNKELTDYVKKVREHLGISQAEFADRIGSNRANVANYETGRAIPPGDVLLEIQKVANATKQTGA
jgi:transcriptional regulator with XRE-family HTH domain